MVSDRDFGSSLADVHFSRKKIDVNYLVMVSALSSHSKKSTLLHQWLKFLCLLIQTILCTTIQASTVTRMDCEIRQNRFHHKVQLPYTTGCDVVGVVVDMGADAEFCDIKLGDRVCTIGLHLGGNAKYVVTTSYQVTKVPMSLDSVEVACLLRTYIVAYQCLHRAGRKN